MKTIVLAFILGLSSCSPKQPLSDQPSKAIVQIESWVPIGTPLVDARRIMGQHNFSCTVMTNSNFDDLKNVDFLYCDHRSTVTAGTMRRWQVALILTKDQISSVRVTSGLVGP